MPKSTPAQLFRKIYRTWETPGTQAGMRANAERQWNVWLKRNGKTFSDIPLILEQADADDKAQATARGEGPPPPDLRAGTPHSYDKSEFSPADAVERVTRKYVAMSEPVCVISTLWACATHVYTQFSVASRLALTSEEPNSGKSTLRKVLAHLVCRPNRAVFSTGAVLKRHFGFGPSGPVPGTILIDEFDLLPEKIRTDVLLLWNHGHEDEKNEMMEGGRFRLYHLYGPMFAAGLGKLFAEGGGQLTRTWLLEMSRYTAETIPDCDYRIYHDVKELNAVYAFLCGWAPRVKLKLDPRMPPALIARDADNARSLLSVADACGGQWPGRARAAVTHLFEKSMAENPRIAMLRHAIAICNALGLDWIQGEQLDRELRRHDRMWNRYRGLVGTELAHPIEPYERRDLLKKVGVVAGQGWTPGRRGEGAHNLRGYKLSQFEAALREHGPAGPERGRLRLITPTSPE